MDNNATQNIIKANQVQGHGMDTEIKEMVVIRFAFKHSYLFINGVVVV